MAARRGCAPTPAIRWPNGVESTEAFDKSGRALQVVHRKGATVLAFREYGYDDAGRLTGVTRANGVNFAFIKATEGGDSFDPLFPSHWTHSAEAGVRRGAYHLFYHCRPASEQARWFIAHVPRDPTALPPVLDMEWTPTSPTCRTRRPAAEIRAEARVFLTAVGRHYGQRPILYTTPDFYRDNDLGRLSGVTFWLRSVAAPVGRAYPGQAWSFWQYSGTGSVPGIPGRVDLNVFAGSARQWADWVGR